MLWHAMACFGQRRLPVRRVPLTELRARNTANFTKFERAACTSASGAFQTKRKPLTVLRAMKATEDAAGRRPRCPEPCGAPLQPPQRHRGDGLAERRVRTFRQADCRGWINASKPRRRIASNELPPEPGVKRSSLNPRSMSSGGP